MDAALDALIERGARRLQADLDRVVSFERRAARLMNFAERPSGEQANLDGANHLGAVARTDAHGGFGIEAAQHAVQILQAMRVRAGFQARAQFLRTRRGVGKALEQRPQIKPGPDGQYREPHALAQIFKHGNGPRRGIPPR